MNFVSEQMSPVVMHGLGQISLTYLFTIPISAFLAKRGLFLGANVSRICFPGERGCGVYSKERKIWFLLGARFVGGGGIGSSPRSRSGLDKQNPAHHQHRGGRKRGEQKQAVGRSRANPRVGLVAAEHVFELPQHSAFVS